MTTTFSWSTNQKIGWSILSFLSGSIGIVSMHWIYNKKTLLGPSETALQIAKENPQIASWQKQQVQFFAHVIGGVTSLLIVPIQLYYLNKVNRNYDDKERARCKYNFWHKWLGRIYIFGGIGIGGVSSIILAKNTHAGPIAKYGFGSLGVLWMFSGCKAYYYAYFKNWKKHRKWMIRNTAMTMAAVTLRIYSPIAYYVIKADRIKAYRIISWLCWIPNLIFAEYWLATS
eukprot:534431_1